MVNEWDRQPPDFPHVRAEEDAQAYHEYYVEYGSANIAGEVSERMGDRRVMVEENPHPYTGIPGVVRVGTEIETVTEAALKHLCCWSKDGPLSSDELIAHIEPLYPRKPKLIFVNSRNIMSVKELWHGHVLVRVN